MRFGYREEKGLPGGSEVLCDFPAHTHTSEEAIHAPLKKAVVSERALTKQQRRGLRTTETTPLVILEARSVKPRP